MIYTVHNFTNDVYLLLREAAFVEHVVQAALPIINSEAGIESKLDFGKKNVA
jgi:hypothetical protein